MKVLIVEDELHATDHLSSLLKEIDPGIEILDNIDSVKDALKWFAKYPQPDLVFMDIQLGDGLSFEIFEAVDLQSPIIFTTAYDEYAIRAFKVNSIDYLLKPIDAEELASAFDKYNALETKQVPQSQIKEVMELLTVQYKSRFVVKIGEHIKSIPTHDIHYFFSRDKATYFTVANKRNYLIDFSLDHVDEILDPKQFLRVNRKYIVRLEAIEDIISYSNSRLKIVLINGPAEDVIVSRDRVADFRKWIDG